MTDKTTFSRGWTSLVRSQFSGFELGDAALGTRVRNLKALPAAVRKAVLELKAHGGKPVVYRLTIATKADATEHRAFGLFNAKSERSRVHVFGPAGEDLGLVRQRKAWENPWSEAQSEGFRHVSGQIDGWQAPMVDV